MVSQLNLPFDLDFKVQQGGSNLSGGQKERVSIARGLLNEKLVTITSQQVHKTKKCSECSRSTLN